MIPSAEDAQQRAFQQRHRALSRNSASSQNAAASPGNRDVNAGQVPQPPAGTNRRFTIAGGHESSGGVPGSRRLSTGGMPDFSRDASTQSLGNDAFSRSGIATGDDEFEEFHRSFTLGTNPLEGLGRTSTPEPTPHNSNATELQRGQSSGELAEDPTVVQARRSMMARTGDRHARGKLPEPKEGQFQPPNSSPEEPKIPPPRTSKRFMEHNKQRSPDILEGRTVQVTGGNVRLRDDEHIVVCESCRLRLIVKKAALLVICQACQRVSCASLRSKPSQSPSI